MILNLGVKTVFKQLTIPKTLVKAMKIIILLMTIACLQVSAKGYAQRISLTAKNKPITTVFYDIEKQSGYIFFLERR